MVWLGGGAEGGRERLAEFGAAKVYVADGEGVDDYVVAPEAEVLRAWSAGCHRPPSWSRPRGEGKEIAGRLAVKICSGVLTDVVDLARGDGGGPVAEQSIFGGAIIVQSRVRSGTPIVAVRPNSAAAGARRRARRRWSPPGSS